jgi:hypothetical protein
VSLRRFKRGRTPALRKDRVGGPIYRSLRAIGRTNVPPLERLLDLTIVRDAYALL